MSHTTLSPSNASRWMACPGGPRLWEGVPSASSIYAEEGTRLHFLAALWLAAGAPPEQITSDDEAVIRSYVEFCLALQDSGGETWIEERIDLTPLLPAEFGVELRGTADFVHYDNQTRHLTVVDLKTGQGVLVSSDTPQTRLYGLGVAQRLERDFKPVDAITVVIVQPRAGDEPVRATTLSYIEVLDFWTTIVDAVGRTVPWDAPLVAGSHCKFCPAAGRCPAQKAAAELSLGALLPVRAAPSPFPTPQLLPPETIGTLLTNIGVVEDFIAGLRQQATFLLERGESVPGWKLVEKRAVRRWTDPDVVKEFAGAVGLTPDDYLASPELLSPAQLEKVLKKRKIDLPTYLISKVSSGTTLAAEDDARPAAASVGALLPPRHDQLEGDVP